MYQALHKKTRGFTLAELLISLAILGVIATFAIPKVLQGQQNKEWNAAAKETMAAISEAHQLLQLNGQLSATTKSTDYMQYINHVKIDTSSVYDHWNGQVILTKTCTATNPCYKLYSGALLQFYDINTFGQELNNHYVYFAYDPDGRQTASTALGPGKSIDMMIYYNGRVSDRSQLQGSEMTYISGAGVGWGGTPTGQSDWFSWE